MLERLAFFCPRHKSPGLCGDWQFIPLALAFGRCRVLSAGRFLRVTHLPGTELREPTSCRTDGFRDLVQVHLRLQVPGSLFI